MEDFGGWNFDVFGGGSTVLATENSGNVLTLMVPKIFFAHRGYIVFFPFLKIQLLQPIYFLRHKFCKKKDMKK